MGVRHVLCVGDEEEEEETPCCIYARSTLSKMSFLIDGFIEPRDNGAGV